ncbi:hypothetical protein FXF51_21570 [Nonomuraea sp. PA05]|uniref:hypothetical protein n=1 Tax=Nonomuraea sp. PA05 TaxID=2604466 RepID=UPI0011D66284|nr:hypothetical protein [Nonomuraea sp. PA05]TYB64316.1 hypothetical protein FXF51_21570 [Nonomuraea sp. PA05]
MTLRRLGPRRLLAVAVTAVAVISAGTLQLGGATAWAATAASPESPDELLDPEEGLDPDEGSDPGEGLDPDTTEKDCDVSDAEPGESALEVTAITPDRVPRSTSPKYAKAARDDRVSIPRLNEANVQQRYLTVEYLLPTGVELTCVRVDLLNTSPQAGRPVLQTVTRAAPTADGGEGVKSIGRDELKVRATFDEQHPSKVKGKPSEVTRVGYRVSLFGKDRDGTVITARKDSADFFPLWRMPAGFDRYGQRDDKRGGDDWCSSFAHGWLSVAANKALLPRINDISGEHARNLGHGTHLTGNDIDAFHPYRFSGVDAGALGSGGLNYNRLVAATKAAMNADEDGLRQVTEWAEATRTRLGKLIDNKNVVRIYYAAGSQVKGDARFVTGWASALLRTGRYEFTDAKKESKEVDLGIGAWSRIDNQVIRAKDFRTDHNDHIHVALSETRRK